jgi:hypothetical protein
MIYYLIQDDLKIRDSIHEDVLNMKDHLRETDKFEVSAVHGWSPREALEYGLKSSSPCVTVLFNGIPVAMFGVVPNAKFRRTGTVWFLGTDDLQRLKKRFVQLSKVYRDLFLNSYEMIYNWVPDGNKSVCDWLAWLGAGFSDPQPYGKSHLPFRFFILAKEKTPCAAQK